MKNEPSEHSQKKKYSEQLPGIKLRTTDQKAQAAQEASVYQHEDVLFSSRYTKPPNVD